MTYPTPQNRRNLAIVLAVSNMGGDSVINQVVDDVKSGYKNAPIARIEDIWFTALCKNDPDEEYDEQNSDRALTSEIDFWEKQLRGREMKTILKTYPYLTDKLETLGLVEVIVVD